ncbi:polysaccharide pyruvyl transferase family protein [Kribbella solani]|uniref:Polysaccharide pyruvyl transferase WcaK-like protein n=1 Tax=Kribbella solani TaxID=236067 RepID=A0A841DMU0_9ACTN|nr:polysaccharide pyruvyl transferase family protein [Kribbella solani]MBB5979211.1 polysaccharide pyruvyl transferase WcaK-like protein [Kribbella solani]
MKVGLYGRLGGGNIGNDAMLDTVLEYLRNEQPQAVLDFMCEGPEEITERYGVPAVQLHWMQSRKPARSRLAQKALTLLRIPPAALIDTWRTARWVRQHDVVMIPGAGVLEATLPERPWELPYSMLVMALSGQLFGVRTGLVCVGGSRVRERAIRVLLRTAARVVDYRSFRDEYSLGVGRETGVAAAQDKAYADLAFGLPVPSDPLPEPKSVGVGVMSYYGSPSDRGRADEIHARYVDQMKQFVRLLVESGRSVRLLIGDRLDEGVADSIVADARTYWTGPGEPPVSYQPFTSFEELMQRVASVQTVVALRYHCVVAGLTVGRPTLALSYGGKHDALMAQMGLADFVQDVKALEVERLVEQVAALEADEDTIVKTLGERSDDCRARLDEQFRDLTAALFSQGTRSRR